MKVSLGMITKYQVKKELHTLQVISSMHGRTMGFDVNKLI
jgi:hypothetical protein